VSLVKRDAKDLDPKYEMILHDAHMRADQMIFKTQEYKEHGFLDFDHMELKKKILKDAYGITWQHIYELNPGMIID